MPHVVYPSLRLQAERTIAIARVVLAGTALFAVWLDPADPMHFAGLTYTLYWAFVVYSGLLLLATVRELPEWMPLATHAVDVIAFALFQYLTLGPSSPFFVYFVFSMFCGAIRWGWRGSLVTGSVVLAFYVALLGSITGANVVPGFEVNRFVIRLAYLGVATGMLVYLGRYEARLRTEIERLARWPVPNASDPRAAVGRILEYAAQLMQAGTVVAVWESSDEPALREAIWTPGGVTVRTHPPGALRPLTDESLTRATFICAGPVRDVRAVMVADHAGRLVRHEGLPLDPLFLDRFSGDGLATAPMRTELITGRVFFSSLGTPPAEAVPLTEVVTREIASSIEQVRVAVERQELAAREERIRVARDLHDGVLQGLTGVRLELRAIANESEASESVRQQLVSLERALAMEQRELRYFISGLEPEADRRIGIDRRSPLATRLDSVRQRLALEWKTPVTLRVSPLVPEVAPSLEEAVPLMVHEAAVNALKHASASRVAVDVETADGHLRISVADDGRGFPFRGSYNHDSLAASQVAPRSLFDRVTALGGTLSIDSSDRGSRVEMLLSL